MILLAGSTTAANAQTAAQPRSAASAISARKPSRFEQSSSERNSSGIKDPGSAAIHPVSGARSENAIGRAPANFLLDQRGIWTSPAHLHLSDATWLVPLGGFAAGLLATAGRA